MVRMIKLRLLCFILCPKIGWADGMGARVFLSCAKSVSLLVECNKVWGRRSVGRGILLLINASSVESPLATIFSLPRPTCVAVFGIDGGGVSTVGPKRGSSACLPRNHPLITHCAPSLTPSLPARLDMDTTGRPWNIAVVVAAWHEGRGGRRELRA